VCTNFKILKVKVPIIFSGTQGFPARRDRRYIDKNFLNLRGKDLRCLTRRFVSPQATSLDAGTDVT
jgi:hypothetical protein